MTDNDNTYQNGYEELEQYDYFASDHINKVSGDYAPLLGLFIINFSILEDLLNSAIADSVNDRTHHFGFIIIERLTIKNKIDLFYNLNLLCESYSDSNKKEKLNDIKNKCLALNTFRNNIAHANWHSLADNGYVRTKIVVDNEDGFVKFRRLQITPKIIEQKLKELDDLIDLIDCYITGCTE